MYLSDETKRILSRQIGIPCEQLVTMDESEIQRYVEKKTGKRFGWLEGIKIKGVSITSIEDKEKKVLENLRKKARRF